MKKLLFIFLTYFLVQQALVAQNADKFNSEANFIADLQLVYARTDNPTTKKVAADFQLTYEKLNAGQKTKVFDLYKNGYKRGLPVSPHLETFLATILSAIEIKKLSTEQLDKYLEVSQLAMQDYRYDRTVVLNYFIAMHNFFAENYIYKTKFNQYQVPATTPFTFGYIKPVDDLALKNKLKEEAVQDTAFEKKAAEDTPVDDNNGWGAPTEPEKLEKEDPWKIESVPNSGDWGNSPWGADETAADTLSPEKKAESNEDEFPSDECLAPTNDTIPRDGVFLVFEKMNLLIASAYDSITIKEVSGVYMPIKNLFTAFGGKIGWTKLGLDEKDVYCELSVYAINLKLPVLHDNTAKMTYKLRLDSAVNGIFEYKGVKMNSKPYAEFPKFTSHHSNIPVKNVAKDMIYKGGFSLAGKKFSSKNYCGEPSTVEVYKDNKLKFKALSRMEYAFADSMLFNEKASITVYMTDTSTITHPGVRLRYMFKTGELTARKEKHEYRYTPFYDSYHKVEVQADNLKWNITADTMSLAILNAKKQIPAEIRSVDYYNENELFELQKLAKFHPLLILGGYLNREPKNGSDKSKRDNERISMSIYLKDVADRTGVPLKGLREIMMDMHRLGFVEYDSRKFKQDSKNEKHFGWVKLLRKGKLYIDAHAKKSDYDKVWLKSFMPNGKNMKLDMKSNEMTVSGVPFFYLKKIDGDQREERLELVEQRATKAAEDSIAKLPTSEQTTLTETGKNLIVDALRVNETKKIDLMDVSVWDTLTIVNPAEAASAALKPKSDIKVEIIVEDPFHSKKEQKEIARKKEEQKQKEAAELAMKKAKLDSIAKANPVKDLRKIKSRQVIIKQNREMEFNGYPVSADKHIQKRDERGNEKDTINNYCRFYGKSFTFSYQDYLIRMPNADSLIFGEADNGIKVTSGTFYLGHPKNKSSNKSYPGFPKFDAEVGGHIDFKSQKILDGAYDSLVKFELEPFTLDSMASSDPENENLMGMFESNGIFPNFRDTIKLGKYEDISLDPKDAAKNKKRQKTKSFGFTHWKGENKDYPKGFPLYRKTNAIFEGDVHLQGNNGIRGDGEIRYLTAKLYSNDFIYYEDSVVTFGKRSSYKVVSNGTIQDTTFTFAGESLQTTYPDVRMKFYGMQWLFERDKKDDTKILRDSMLLKSNEGLPFEMYYKHPNPEQQGTFQGTLSLTDRALRGSGQFDNKNSTAESKAFLFANNKYNSRNTFFVIKRPIVKGEAEAANKTALRDNAVEATNVKVDYEFDAGLSDEEQTGHAVIEVEQKGQQSFVFPDAKYKTSLGRADWFFAEKVFTMRLPEGGKLEDAVFSSTHLSPKDNISFEGGNAVYNLSNYELQVGSVPYIYSMHARIIPVNGDVRIKKGAKMEPLENAMVELLANKTDNDTVVHHTLYNCSIEIVSRNKFKGKGIYKYTNDAKELYNIAFNSFETIGRRSEDDTIRIVDARTKIVEKDKFMKQAGVQFRGDVELRADSINLIFKGEIKFIDEPNSSWFPLESSGGAIAVKGVEEVDGKLYGTGIFLHDENKTLKTAFKSEIAKDDKPIFQSNGVFRKDESGDLVIEPLERQRIDAEKPHLKYTGNNFIYNSKTGKAHFDGLLDLIKQRGNGFEFKTIGIGSVDITKKQYQISTMIALTIPEVKGAAFKKMGDDVAKFIKNTDPRYIARPNDSTLYKMSHLVPADKFDDYYKDVSRGKAEYSDYLDNSLVLTHVNLYWSDAHKAFYSKGKIGLGSIFKEETNIWVDGFVEIPFDAQNPKNQYINVYLELSKNKWFFFTQRGDDLKMLASDVPASEGTNDYGTPEFNTEIGNPKSKDKFKLADATEKARFRSSFRLNYLGDNTPEPEPEKKEDEEKTIEDEKKEEKDDKEKKKGGGK
jgi:hypothetical protein